MPVRPALPTRALGGSALLLLPLLSAACSGDTSADAAPALTRQQAEQALNRYAAAVTTAGQSLDPAALSPVEGAPLLPMDVASVKLRKAVKKKAAPLKFSSTSFLIPRLSGYPRWFAVDAVSRTGRQGFRHALLFTQAKEGAPWLATADPFPADTSLAKAARDEGGFAAPVPLDAKGLAIAPGRIGAAHTALLNGGPKAAGAGGIAPGPQTTGAYEALRAGQSALTKRGVDMKAAFSPDAAPTYALRTKDGGALVWYTVKQTEAYSAAKRGRLRLSGDLIGLTTPDSVKKRMNSTVLIQYLAVVPPHGAATVNGIYRKAIAVDAS
ncbi:hypothetical protein [Actinomadura macrotermitis]|uniref:DUF8094 domain-containing protein n=1 Tax=Actinomadura macrotermitis TaxID=2585200 RepID=A0A7K0C133_9ACTN|nr:hypothetical protein [Actinomadura macrotermitis]MQY07066.1 hypothetical protein [Actinomadura macrotermitis]